MPDWLMTGITILIPKQESTERTKNYRPITCLPTMHITIMSIISKWIQKYIDDRNLIPKGKKGGCKGLKGCKDQLLISKTILQLRKCRKKMYVCLR